MTTHSCTRSVRIAFVLLLAFPLATRAADDGQKTFAEPDAAVRALVDAAGKHDEAALHEILGAGSDDVVSSGDEVADRAGRERVAAAAKVRTWLETLESGRVIAHLGKDDWPLPIPLVKEGTQWHFDTVAGREELLNRRIGRNELNAIAVARAYVDAQREFASLKSAGGVPVYAQKVRSEEGKHDGLYWDDPTGTAPSPLGPLVAEATAEGYGKAEEGAGPQPYHGYFYRILTAQGPNAPGGVKSYVKDGAMTGGFALVAHPAEHGNSGIMTFLVGPQGIVYQKNLGATTVDVVKAMTAYDPDDSWAPVRD